VECAVQFLICHDPACAAYDERTGYLRLATPGKST